MLTTFEKCVLLLSLILPLLLLLNSGTSALSFVILYTSIFCLHEVQWQDVLYVDLLFDNQLKWWWWAAICLGWNKMFTLMKCDFMEEILLTLQGLSQLTVGKWYLTDLPSFPPSFLPSFLPFPKNILGPPAVTKSIIKNHASTELLLFLKKR